ncbi:MAG: hypothetical protein U1E76_19870 [Planctomycetota bacterium]
MRREPALQRARSRHHEICRNQHPALVAKVAAMHRVVGEVHERGARQQAAQVMECWVKGNRHSGRGHVAQTPSQQRRQHPFTRESGAEHIEHAQPRQVALAQWYAPRAQPARRVEEQHVVVARQLRRHVVLAERQEVPWLAGGHQDGSIAKVHAHRSADPAIQGDGLAAGDATWHAVPEQLPQEAHAK